jgi:hypothetical protein
VEDSMISAIHWSFIRGVFEVLLLTRGSGI